MCHIMGQSTKQREQIMKLRYQVKDRETGEVMREVEAEDYGQACLAASILAFNPKFYFVSLVG